MACSDTAGISTTLNIYTHVVDASHRQALEALERQLFPTVPKSQVGRSVRLAKCHETCWLELEAPPGLEPEMEVLQGHRRSFSSIDDSRDHVTFMDYDLGYFDDETCRPDPIANPFGPKVLPMCPE